MARPFWIAIIAFFNFIKLVYAFVWWVLTVFKNDVKLSMHVHGLLELLFVWLPVVLELEFWFVVLWLHVGGTAADDSAVAVASAVAAVVVVAAADTVTGADDVIGVFVVTSVVADGVEV
jgi:hypothetical protein